MPAKYYRGMGTGAQTLIVAALIVLVIVLVVYAAVHDPTWAHLGYWKAHYVETPDEIYRRSAGVFDLAAALALRRSLARPDPEPGDHLRAARIVHHNVLIPGTDGPGLAGAHNFTRAQYAAAVGGIDRHAWEGVEDPRAAFIAAAALRFAYGGGADVFDGLGVDGGLAEMARSTHGRLQTQRREAAQRDAAGQGGGAGAVADAYLARNIQYADDPESVHDTSVNASNRAIVARLRADQGPYDRLPTLPQIAEDIREEAGRLSADPRTAAPRPRRTEKALVVVGRAAGSENYSAVGASDEEVLRRVWARADDPRNAETREGLRQAIFDQLNDCWKEGISGEEVVCVGGRVADILSALVLLDFDSSNWEIQTLEHHRNEIMAAAQQEIRAAAQEASDSADPALQKVGRSYRANSRAELDAVGDLDPKTVETFEGGLRARLSAMVAGEVSKINGRSPGSIPAYAAKQLAADASAAV